MKEQIIKILESYGYIDDANRIADGIVGMIAWYHLTGSMPKEGMFHNPENSEEVLTLTSDEIRKIRQLIATHCGRS